MYLARYFCASLSAASVADRRLLAECLTLTIVPVTGSFFLIQVPLESRGVNLSVFKNVGFSCSCQNSTVTVT